MTTKFLFLLIISSLIISGCTALKLPSSTPKSPSPTPTQVIESSGDAQQDTQAIQQDIDALNADQDFADFNVSDYTR